MNKGGPLTTQAGCLSDLLNSSVAITKISLVWLNRFNISIFISNLNKFSLIIKNIDKKMYSKTCGDAFYIYYFFSFRF